MATAVEMLGKALEAEEAAAEALDPRIKEAWMKIAENYRTLARTMGHLEHVAPDPQRSK